MAWHETPQPACPSWHEDDTSCGGAPENHLKINDDDLLLINDNDFLIISTQLWNEEVTETC